MELYLMQHGEALSEDEDPQRPLSEQGIETIEASARAIAEMGLHFDVIAASTKARARQTAEIVATATGYDHAGIVVHDAFKPSAPLSGVLALLEGFVDRESVFIAGHLPSLKGLAAALLSPDGNIRIDIRNGGLCRIDLQEIPTDTAELRWYIPPEEMQLIGRGVRDKDETIPSGPAD